jgi:hypothetical protein
MTRGALAAPARGASRPLCKKTTSDILLLEGAFSTAMSTRTLRNYCFATAVHCDFFGAGNAQSAPVAPRRPGGINPEKNPGVYHFKRGLSGEVKHFAGTFTMSIGAISKVISAGIALHRAVKINF